MLELFAEKGRHARSVLGAASLRDNLPIVVDSIFELKSFLENLKQMCYHSGSILRMESQMSEKNSNEHQAYLEENRAIWEKEAPQFDKEADHGLGQPHVRAAWKNLLENTIHGKGLDVLDIGCGTGSLSLLLAELEHTVTGVDLAPTMIAQAKAKVENAKLLIDFQVMDAAFPDFPEKQFDVILCRHLLWTLPEPAQVLQRWIKLLKPKGQLLLIEGFWHTGAGLKSQDLLAMLPENLDEIRSQSLSENSDLWGNAVTDERYLIHAMFT